MWLIRKYLLAVSVGGSFRQRSGEGQFRTAFAPFGGSTMARWDLVRPAAGPKAGNVKIENQPWIVVRIWLALVARRMKYTKSDAPLPGRMAESV
jgi:hypothetical protein